MENCLWSITTHILKTNSVLPFDLFKLKQVTILCSAMSLNSFQTCKGDGLTLSCLPLKILLNPGLLYLKYSLRYWNGREKWETIAGLKVSGLRLNACFKATIGQLWKHSAQCSGHPSRPSCCCHYPFYYITMLSSSWHRAHGLYAHNHNSDIISKSQAFNYMLVHCWVMRCCCLHITIQTT